jgi:Tol biopolymer transport system component
MLTDNLERSLPELLHQLANEQTPDYYPDLFWQTAHTSQRSAWTIRERWLPMLEIARRPVAPQLPWRPIAVFLLLVAALAASLALAAAQPKPPPPTGPAGNGLVGVAGDILTIDPRTGASKVIVGGPEIDSDPIWSQDGTKIVFRRASPDQPDADILMFVSADGSGLKQLTPEPTTGLTSWTVRSNLAPALRYALSPDGRTVLMIATINGIPVLLVGDTNGSSLRRIDVPQMPMGAAFDPTGKNILFIGAQGFDGSYSGLYVIGADGSNLRTLVQPRLEAQIWSRAYWSPDGSQVAFARIEPASTPSFDRGQTPLRLNQRVHVISTDGTGEDRIVGHKEGAWWEAPTGWSPDGRKLLIERSLVADAPGAPFEAAIIDVAGQAPDVESEFQSAFDWWATWSPDGTTILATPTDADGNRLQQQLWDARTGKAMPAPWTATSVPSWQRVAP